MDNTDRKTRILNYARNHPGRLAPSPTEELDLAMDTLADMSDPLRTNSSSLNASDLQSAAQQVLKAYAKVQENQDAVLAQILA